MIRFRKIFQSRHVTLPVIHVESEEQTLRNVRIARDAGTDGVFLINHEVFAPKLLSIYRAVVAAHSNWWVGLNCLDLSPVQVFQDIDASVSGVWVDNAMIDEDAAEQPNAQQVLDAQKEKSWPGLYFGGVAFKYQRPVNDLAKSAMTAARYMDVVTTSGPGTGHAALPEKIRTMKQALGDHPLAIASGITPENVHDYLDSADCFLVASGISQSFEELDPDRVRELVQVVRGAER